MVNTQPQQLFSDLDFVHNCTKCGHSQELHTSRGCSGTVGHEECMCYRFAHNPRPDLFNDRREKET